MRNGRTQEYVARREIIIAGGALSSPGLLQRSGVGPAALLQKLGIPLVFDAPEVGQSLIEHRAILMSWKLGKPLSQNPSFGGWRLLRSVGQYFFSRSGPMAAAAGPFQIPFNGSFGLLLVSLILFILSVVGIGLMISAISATQQQAILGAFAIGVPSVLMSGFAPPAETHPLLERKSVV